MKFLNSRLWISFVFIVFVAGCIPSVDKNVEAYKVVIAGRILKIPQGYFDGGKPFGRDTESVVLEYSFPDFQVLPEHPQERSARKKLILEGRMKGMLLEASDARPSFDAMIEGQERAGNLGIREGDAFGLEKYTAPPRGKSKYKPDDTFIESEAKGGEVISILRCSPPGKDKVPGCSHKFRDKGILYRIRWPIRELSNWREQRDAAIVFIDSMEVKQKYEGK